MSIYVIFSEIILIEKKIQFSGRLWKNLEQFFAQKA